MNINYDLIYILPLILIFVILLTKNNNNIDKSHKKINNEEIEKEIENLENDTKNYFKFDINNQDIKNIKKERKRRKQNNNKKNDYKYERELEETFKNVLGSKIVKEQIDISLNKINRSLSNLKGDSEGLNNIMEKFDSEIGLDRDFSKLGDNDEKIDRFVNKFVEGKTESDKLNLKMKMKLILLNQEKMQKFSENSCINNILNK